MAGRDRFNLWLPFYSAIGSILLFLPVIIYGGDVDFLYVLFAVPTSIIFLTAALIFSIRKLKLRSLAVLSMVVVFWVVSWGLLKNSRVLHSTVQWHIRSKDYKAKVLAQPVTANGELKHVEWDGWGFAGADTVMSLVFDPTDSLSMAAKSHSSGKLNGIPCEVYRVRRLESHYYTVLFYTNTNWDRCD
jgi:hypothetical protein